MQGQKGLCSSADQPPPPHCAASLNITGVKIVAKVNNAPVTVLDLSSAIDWATDTDLADLGAVKEQGRQSLRSDAPASPPPTPSLGPPWPLRSRIPIVPPPPALAAFSYPQLLAGMRAAGLTGVTEL